MIKKFYHSLLCAHILSILCTLSATSTDEYYVFFRGHHFLKGIEINEEVRGSPICARGYSGLSEIEVEHLREQMISLERPWSSTERIAFQPRCYSPLTELIERYTNSYTKFTTDLTNADSRTRRMLRLAGLEIRENPFISTTLKSLQAYKYGYGLKLFGHEELRRYPQYNSEGIPNKTELGYVDVILLSQKDTKKIKPFFVVESFCRGDTYLSSHWSKKLTEEEEVIFFFNIPSRYHKARIVLSPPHLNRPLDKLSVSYWSRQLLRARSVGEPLLPIEDKLVKRLSKINSDYAESMVMSYLTENKLKRLFTSKTISLITSKLVPDDAACIRHQIVRLVDSWGRDGVRDFDLSSYILSPSDKLIYAFAIRSLGLTVPISLEIGISLDLPISYGVLCLLAEAPELKYVSLRGPDEEGLCPEIHDEDYDEADLLIPLANLNNFGGWRRPSSGFKRFLEALKERSRRGYSFISIDVTGQALAPAEFNALCELTDLTDDNRDIDEEAMDAATRRFALSPSSLDDEADDFI